MYKLRMVQGELTGRNVVAVATGYVFWIVATRGGLAFTCATGDDGYAGTLPVERQVGGCGFVCNAMILTH